MRERRARRTKRRASAYFTWNALDKNATDLTSIGSVSRLFVYVERAGGLTFKGGEVDLTWNPGGDGSGCLDRTGVVFRTSGTGTCTYLNRGMAVHVIDTDDPNHFHFAWANTSTLTGCTAGVIVEIDFELDACVDPRGCFTMNYCALLDGSSLIDEAIRAGRHATVNGGTALCDDLPRTFYVDRSSPAPSATERAGRPRCTRSGKVSPSRGPICPTACSSRRARTSRTT
jgi:hypothetical protein